MADMTRRDFTLASALAMLSGVTITITGCGGGGGGTNNPTPPANPGDEVGTVSANHGHVAIIRAAELGAGASLNLDISGSAGHPHTVSLSASEVTQIAGGARVTKTSTTEDSHNHQVTFN